MPLEGVNTSQVKVSKFLNCMSDNLTFESVYSNEFDINILGESELSSVNLLFYPNPANDNLSIKLSSELFHTSGWSEGMIRLQNVTGSTVMMTPYSNGFSILDVSSIKSGVYLIEVTSGEKMFHKKIMIVH